MEEVQRAGPEWRGATLSEGTLVPGDVIDNLLSNFLLIDKEAALEWEKEYCEELDELDSAPRKREYRDREGVREEYRQERIYLQGGMRDELMDILSQYAPEGTEFGGAEGDPASLGFYIVDGEEY